MTMPALRSIARQAGFTIMEILIAVAILVVGLLGIVALFPFAVELGNRSIQETNAVLLAQSVERALREGLANRKGHSPDGKWTFFLFQHAGVLDPLPRDMASADPAHDYYILLPDLDTEGAGRERPRSAENKPVFLYPEDDGVSWFHFDLTGRKENEGDSRATPNGGGDPTKADDDSDDGQSQVPGRPALEVRRVYQVGASELRAALEGEAAGVDLTDPILQYSYAFSLRRAYHDPSLGRHALSETVHVPASELFECEIMVFRQFIPDSPLFSKPYYTTRIYLEK